MDLKYKIVGGGTFPSGAKIAEISKKEEANFLKEAEENGIQVELVTEDVDPPKKSTKIKKDRWSPPKDWKPFELEKPQLQKEIESFSPPQSRGEWERTGGEGGENYANEEVDYYGYSWLSSQNKFSSKEEVDERYTNNLQNIIHHDVEDAPSPDLASGNMGRQEVDRLVGWFNNDSNYSNSGVRLNVSSRDSKFQEVELLFWNQEPGQGHTFDIKDPKLFDNIKTQIDQEVHTDKKIKNLDYLSKLIPPQILNYTDDGYGNDEVNKATFHKNLSTIVNFIKNKKQDASYLGSYSDPESEFTTTNITLEEIEEFFKDPVNSQQLLMYLKDDEKDIFPLGKFHETSTGFLPRSYKKFRYGVGTNLEAQVPTITMPDGSVVSYDYIWRNRKQAYNYWKENNKINKVQEDREIVSEGNPNISEDEKRQLLLNETDYNAKNSGYLLLARNGDTANIINDLNDQIKDFKENYKEDSPIKENAEYKKLISERDRLVQSLGITDDMKILDDNNNYIGIEKNWVYNKEKNQWINTKTNEVRDVIVNEENAQKRAATNSRTELEDMFVESSIELREIAKLIALDHERIHGKHTWFHKKLSALIDFDKSSWMRDARQLQKVLATNSIFNLDQEVPGISEDFLETGMIGKDLPRLTKLSGNTDLEKEFNKALEEFVTNYYALKLNVNPMKMPVESFITETLTKAQRTFGGEHYGSKITYDDLDETFEHQFKEGDDYSLLDVEDRKSKGRQFYDVVSGGVIDISQLTLGIYMGNKVTGFAKAANFLQKAYKGTKRYKNMSKFSAAVSDISFSGIKTAAEWSIGEGVYSTVIGNDIQQTFYWDDEKGEMVIHPTAAIALGSGTIIYKKFKDVVNNSLMLRSANYRKLNKITPDMFKAAQNAVGSGVTPALLLSAGTGVDQFLKYGKIYLETEYDDEGNIITPSMFGPDGMKSLAESIIMFSSYGLMKGGTRTFYNAAKADVLKFKGIDVNQRVHQNSLNINQKEVDGDGIIDPDVVQKNARKERNKNNKKLKKVTKKIKEVEQSKLLQVEQKGKKLTELENQKTELNKKKKEIDNAEKMLNTYNIVNEARAIAKADNAYDQYLLQEFLETDAFTNLRRGVGKMSIEQLELIANQRYGLRPEALEIIYDKLNIKESERAYYDFVVNRIREDASILDHMKVPKGMANKAREKYIKNSHKAAFNEAQIIKLEEASEKNPSAKSKNDNLIKKLKEENKKLLEENDIQINKFNKNFKDRLKRENDYLRDVVEKEGKTYKTYNTEQFKKAVKENEGVYDKSMNAFITEKGDKIFIDLQKAAKNKSLGLGIHEVAHMLLIDSFKANKNGKRVVSEQGIKTIDFMLDKLPGGRYGKDFKLLNDIVETNYRYEVDVKASMKASIRTGEKKYIFKKDANGKRIEKPKEEYYEEYVGKLAEFIKEGRIKSTAGLGTRIGKALYPILKKNLPQLYKFDINGTDSKKAGGDMLKFIDWMATTGLTKNVLDVSVGGKSSSGKGLGAESRDINNQIKKLKPGSELIVKENTKITSALIKRAQQKFGDNWKEILKSDAPENKAKQKEFAKETSDLRIGETNSITSVNEGVIYYMANHPKYGRKGESAGGVYTEKTQKEFIEGFKKELEDLAMTYNPAKNDAVGAYLLQTIKKRYPGIMDVVSKESSTKSLTTEDGTQIEIRDLDSYEKLESENILESEFRKRRNEKLIEEVSKEISQSKLRREIGIEDTQKEKIFEQVKKDLQLTKSPIGITKRSFLSSLNKATENSHYDILKDLPNEKIIELKNAILESIPISELVQMGKFLPQGNIFIKEYTHPTKTKWGANAEIMEFMGIRPDGGFKFNTSGKNLLPEMKSLFDVFSKMPQAEQKASAEFKEFNKKIKAGFPKIYERKNVGINEWKTYIESSTKGKRQVAEKSGTKGNNRINLLKKLSTSLTKDAIPEILENNKEFVDRYMDVKGLKEQVEAKALIEQFVNNIERRQGMQFSKNVDQALEKARLERREMINAGEKSIRGMFTIINKVASVGVQNVYDFSPMGEKFKYELKKEFKDLISNSEAKFIFENLILENKVFNHEGGVEVKKILEGIESKGNKRSLGFEQFIMNQFKGVKGIVLKTEFQTEIGDMADVPAEIAGRAFNVEVKMHNARLGSLTASLNMKNNTIGEVTTKDFNKFRDKAQIESLLKESLKGWRKIRSYYKKLSTIKEGTVIDGVEVSKRDKILLKNFNKHNNAIPGWAFKLALEAKLYNQARSTGIFKETLVEDMYLLKTNPSEYMLWLGKGLLHLGKNSFGLETTKLEGEFFGSWGHSKRSIKSITTKHEAFITKKNPKGIIDANGLVTASLRFIPTAKKVTSKNSKINVTSKQGLQVFNSSVKNATKIIKAQEKAKAQGQASKSINNVIDFATGKIKRKGMSTFDFDDTVGRTKSGVRARVPNADGTPKPKRKVIFLAGGAGSGKGNVIKKLELEKQGFKIVNSDISLEWLKKNNGLPENMNDLTKEQRSTLGKLGHESRQIAKRKMMKYQGNAEGVVIDGTGGSVKTMEKLVKEFKDKGYDTSMLFVETSLDVALERNKARKERSLLDVIVRRNHEAVQKNKSPFKEMFQQNFMEVKTDKLTMESAMPRELVSKMGEFVRGYEKIRLDAEEFASKGEMIKNKGGEFDFSEFNKVVEGQPGPFLEKLKERIKEYGSKDVFILTARPAASAIAIKEFLKEQGIDIPVENITGLGNSTGKAKAQWMLKKFSEGYNDMYFVDDAFQNVKAVKDVLNRLDVNSKVVQAKLQFSKNIDAKFGDIIERISKGKIKSTKEMSLAEARTLGKAKGRFDYFVPPSAEDLKGLIYKLLGKGRQGDADMKFFKESLFDPWAKGIRDLTIVKQKMVEEYAKLKKDNKKLKLNKKVEGTPYTVDAAVRMYLWEKAGHEVPGINKAEQKTLTDYVKSRPELISFAETLGSISRIKEGYEKPSDYWMVENIGADLNNITLNRTRKDFLHEWVENKNIIFSEKNLNKLEAQFGPSYREALENMLTRMELGTNRLQGIKDGPTKLWYDWVNGSVGATMFWNTRSAALQTISMVNFTNMAENNIFAQTRTFANQKQFWSDFAMLFNSPMLKQRRGGLEIDVSASELTNMFQKSGRDPRSILKYMLEKGFTPTRIADSFAIAMGGSSFYRNRYNKYIKEGMSKAKAKEQAMLDFQEIAEETQQSSRPDLISQQQAGPLGRIILAWQNTPMQMTRLMKKKLSDIVNRRRKPGQTQVQSDLANLSGILYYGAIQNLWFGMLQSGLAWTMYGSDMDDKFEDKTNKVLNGAFDTLLRGTGIYGAAFSTMKNTILRYYEEKEKGFIGDQAYTVIEALGISPPIGSKVRKMYSAINAWDKFDARGVSQEIGLRIENPELLAIANIIEATTNTPLARMINKANNLEEAITGNHETWQRIALLGGWSRWNVNVKDEELEEAKVVAKEKNIEKRKQEKIEKKKEEEEEKKKAGLKQIRCSGTNSRGKRCSLVSDYTKEKSWKCFHHMKFTDGMDRDGDGIKEYRCSARTGSGKRCKNKTENKNKKCYAHQ